MNALNNKSQTELSVTSVRGRALDLGSRKLWLEWRPLLFATVAIFGFVDYDCCDSMSEEEERSELSATYLSRRKIKVALIDQRSKRLIAVSVRGIAKPSGRLACSPGSANSPVFMRLPAFCGVPA
jgi:hypothetical protein